MTVYLLITAGSFAISVYFVLSAKAMRCGRERIKLHPTFVFGFSHFAASFFLLPFVAVALWKQPISSLLTYSFWIPAVISIALHICSKLMHFAALSLVDVAQVSPFSALTPVITIAAGWLVLHEAPSLQGVGGILLIFVSLLGLHNGFRSDFFSHLKNDLRWGALSKSGSFLAFLSVIPVSFGIPFQKMAVVVSGSLLYSFLMLLLSGIIGLGVSLRRVGYKKLLIQLDAKQAVILLQASGALGVASLFFLEALKYGVVAHITAMTRLSIVFQVLLAYALLNQREQIVRRTLYALAVVVGVVLVGMSMPTR